MLLVSFENMKIIFLLSAFCLVTNAQKIVGGVTEADNDEVASALAFATKVVNEGLHPASRYLHVEPVTSHKQIVSGVNYKMIVHIYETSCLIYQLGESKPSENECPKGRKLTETPCSVEVWDQPWRGGERFKITKNECVTTMANAKPMLGDLLGEDSFSTFEKTYQKNYATSEERTARFEIFKSNMLEAFKLQSLERGTAVYGPSIFADLTPEEFNVRRGLKLKQPVIEPEAPIINSKIAAEQPEPVEQFEPLELPSDVPASWDWREHNAVSTVKNQGNCGSCWAFSTTGNVEGAWAIKKNQLVSLSEQELLDCDTVDQACNGGLMWDAYQEIIRIGGLEGEKDYPYETRKEDQCHWDKSKLRAKITGWTNISSDENEMARWLQQNGPIAIGINANAMQLYMGGVSHPPSVMCNPSGIDHGVLIVGYGKTWLFRTPFWIVKNSWGTGWGEKGYYRVYRGSGVCGLNVAATSALV